MFFLILTGYNNLTIVQIIENNTMSYKVSLLPDEPIILVVWHEDFVLTVDLIPAIEEMRQLLDSATEPHFIISDLTRLNLKFDDLLVGAYYGVKGANPIFKHTNLAGITLVSHHQVTEIMAKGMKTATFGYMDVPVVRTMEDALAVARSRR